MAGGEGTENAGGGGVIPAVLSTLVTPVGGGGTGEGVSRGGSRLWFCTGDTEPTSSASGTAAELSATTSPGAPGQRERGTGTEKDRGIAPLHREKDETPPSRRTPGVPVHRRAPKTPVRHRGEGRPRRNLSPLSEAAYET